VQHTKMGAHRAAEIVELEEAALKATPLAQMPPSRTRGVEL
jgi:hypothetical protein